VVGLLRGRKNDLSIQVRVRYALLWDDTLGRLVVNHTRFGKTSRFQWSCFLDCLILVGKDMFPATSVTNNVQGLPEKYPAIMSILITSHVAVGS
jgi:hypothetical protein